MPAVAPFLARFPGRIPKGKTCGGIASTTDILPALAQLCGAAPPNNPLDGIDIRPMLSGAKGEIEREENPRVVAGIGARIDRLMATFPEPIRRAYTETRSRATGNHAVGAVTRPADR